MGKLIDKITLTKLNIIENEKGNLFHAMKKSSTGFAGFGEAYFTHVKKRNIKGWKRHKAMTLNLVVISGLVEIVLVEDKELIEISRKRIILGGENYSRLTVPPGLWMAFSGVSDQENIMLNISNIEHDPKESENLPLDSFLFGDVCE